MARVIDRPEMRTKDYFDLWDVTLDDREAVTVVKIQFPYGVSLSCHPESLNAVHSVETDQYLFSYRFFLH